MKTQNLKISDVDNILLLLEASKGKTVKELENLKSEFESVFGKIQTVKRMISTEHKIHALNQFYELLSESDKDSGVEHIIKLMKATLNRKSNLVLTDFDFETNFDTISKIESKIEVFRMVYPHLKKIVESSSTLNNFVDFKKIEWVFKG